jgi:tetratricopeptide (TPR) repeat protein
MLRSVLKSSRIVEDQAMTPAFGAQMWMAAFSYLILATATPARSQPAIEQPAGSAPLPQPGTASSQTGSLYIQGHDAQVRNDLPAALSLLDQVISVSPDYFPAYVDRGIVHYKMGQFESAASDLSKAIELGKVSSTLRFAYKLLGICYRKLNRPLDSVRVYSEYLDGMGSGDWDGVAERGEAYAQAHEAAKARQDYQRALQLSPNNLRVMGMITALDLQTADWAQALEDSTRWLALEPGQALAVKAQALARSHLSGGMSPANR